MPGGADWEREIEQKLRACDIFVLLVSPNSLGSDYVVDKEIAIIRERQAKREAVHFYPLVLTPTPKAGLDVVRDKNLRPKDGRPLSDYSINERFRQMADAADELAEIAALISRQATPPTHAPGTGPNSPTQKIVDEKSFERWLRGRPWDVVVTIAARAALRVAPLADAMASPRFRAIALARVAGKYPTRAKQLRAALAAALATARAADAANLAALAATRAAAVATALAADAGTLVAVDAGRAVARAADAARGVDGAAARDFWAEVRADSDAISVEGTAALADRPLWRLGVPGWVGDHWAKLQSALPKEQGWDVWIDWYDERLFGGSRGKEHELVFASVPKEIWEEGSAASNAWIKAHLPKPPETAPAAALPEPLPGLDAPFAYGWNASQHVTAVAGAQNLPFYPHFSSEQDHRHALEAARVGGERLLKALRDGRYNARPEYGEALEYYLDDLPKTAGAGNILLANDQVRILHAMFLADAAMLPEGFASRLKSVIANQFALNAFYDLVQRHNEAVSAGNWSQPFPLDAARGFFGAVEDHTPRWFEPQVEQGLRQVEQAEPPPAAAPEAAPRRPPQSSRRRCRPGRRTRRNSWRRQMATAANALWETFLQGRDLPVAQDEWRQAADAPRRARPADPRVPASAGGGEGVALLPQAGEGGRAQRGRAESARQAHRCVMSDCRGGRHRAKRSRAGLVLPVDFSEALPCSPNPSRSSSPTPTPTNPSRW